MTICQVCLQTRESAFPPRAATDTSAGGEAISLTASVTPLTMNSSASIIGMMTSNAMEFSNFSNSSTIYLYFSSSSEITFIATLSSKSAEGRATSTVTPILSFSGESLSSYSKITIHSSVAARSTVAVLSTVPSPQISSFSTSVLTVPSSVTSNTEAASNIGPTILSSSNQTSFVSFPSGNMISIM